MVILICLVIVIVIIHHQFLLFIINTISWMTNCDTFIHHWGYRSNDFGREKLCGESCHWNSSGLSSGASISLHARRLEKSPGTSRFTLLPVSTWFRNPPIQIRHSINGINASATTHGKSWQNPNALVCADGYSKAPSAVTVDPVPVAKFGQALTTFIGCFDDFPNEQGP